jgi:hypothetical protein
MATAFHTMRSQAYYEATSHSVPQQGTMPNKLESALTECWETVTLIASKVR